MTNSWRRRARELKTLVRALWIAYRDPRTPALARAVAALVVGYALSPIDLIPDVIPVLGYLDDLVLIPLGVALAIRLIPAGVWADARNEAARAPVAVTAAGRVAAVVIVVLWLLTAALAIVFLRRWW